MNPLPYQKIYWGDYLRDTRHLSTEEHGAYLLLIAAYWEAGKALEDDDQQLARLTGLSLKKWKMVRPKILRFFSQREGHFFHPRIEKDLAESRQLSETKRKIGKSGGRPKKATANLQVSPSLTNSITNSKAHSTLSTHSSTDPNGSAEQSYSSTIRDRSAQPKQNPSESIFDFPDQPKPEFPEIDENRVESPTVAFLHDWPPNHQNANEQRPRPVPGGLRGIPEQYREAIAACFAAAGPGLADPAKTPSLHTTAVRIVAALEAGCDLHADIIPIIQSRTGKSHRNQITTWSYFEAAWINQRDSRLTELPKFDPTRISKEISHGQSAHSYQPRSAGEQREIRHRAAIRLLRDIGALDGPNVAAAG